MTDLGSDTYYEAYRINSWNPTAIKYALSGAVGSSSSSTHGVWLNDAGFMFNLSGGSGHTVAVQAAGPLDAVNHSIGDIVGFTDGSSGDRPCLWPEGGTFSILLGLGGVGGQATRTNSSNRRIGWIRTSGGFVVPFAQTGNPLLSTTYVDLRGTSSYESGVAEAVSDSGTVAGWVDDGNGNALVCRWDYNSLSGTYSNPLPLDANLSLFGSVSQVYGGGSANTVVLGYDTTLNKPFRWEGNEFGTVSLMHFGKAGEIELPSQASIDGFSSAFKNYVQPCYFALPSQPGRLVDGVGCADDLLSMSPDSVATEITSATTATGIADTTLGGTNFGSGKLWIAPPSGAFALSDFISIQPNIGTHVNIADPDSDSAFVDGLTYSMKKTFGGAAGEICRVTAEHVFPAGPGQYSVFRVTSRVNGNYELWLSFYDWTVGSPHFLPFFKAGTVKSYMQTIDADMNDSRLFSASNHFKVQISLRHGSSAVNQPTWGIEQSCGITWTP